ncbi:thiamine transporter 2-like [Anneissia japonica]|uniref:thiamine transporter 2-like n=1 Tax=Anneissia japonica TaxID=1529436 RepID=UPI0014255AB8|nr:thiamine transporter 2-like [Anneissia japonica]XP_033110339.1 thiamine transporter 2-like [Anneissia japonica]XP_033110340.1 thiamine transporter 2-like [Anneissia japonica]
MENLQSWKIATILLCLYGFFKELRPSEPYLTPFLLESKNVTEDEVDNQIYPIWTYSYMVSLVLVFLVTDFLLYKPVIVSEGIAYLATWSLLLWASGAMLMKLMQFFYGVATATEIAYYSYIYAVVTPEHYQKVSSFTRSSVLIGRFFAGVLGQLLLSLNLLEYFGLNVISMVSVSIAFLISLSLPLVKTSVYFHTDEDLNDGSIPSDTSDTRPTDNEPIRDTEYLTPPDINITVKQNCQSSFQRLWSDFKACYSSRNLLQWSFWWAFATCGYFQVGNYIQNLWDVILYKQSNGGSHHQVWNGAVEAAATLAGALSAFLIMFSNVNWDIFGEAILAAVSVLDAILLTFMGWTTNIWLCYAFYILFRSSYQLVITIASYQIARHLASERFALVFGCNTFIALVLESILTIIFVDYRGLNLPADTQFLVYGGYYYILAVFFTARAVYELTTLGWRQAWRHRYRPKDAPGDDDSNSTEINHLHVPSDVTASAINV